MWIGTNDGVASFDGLAWHTYPRRGNALMWDEVVAMAAAPDGSVWFTTESSGTTRFDGKRWISYTDVDGLADMWTSAIAVEPDGAAWIASDGGLSHFLPSLR